MKHCGATIQDPGGGRKRGGTKHILEALSCLNGGSARSNARQMRSMAHSIKTGQTTLHACCPTGIKAHTKVVIFYDMTSMVSGELADAFLGTNKFFNDIKDSDGFFGDVYHVAAYGERWVTWPAWVLNRNVHTRGIESHVNAPDQGGVDSMSILPNWSTADGGGGMTGSVNGAVTFDGSDNLKTVYYGQNQTTPGMPPVFSSTEELLVINFCDESACTPNKTGTLTSYGGGDAGPAGSYLLGGYYDQKQGNYGLATDGSAVPTFVHAASSHDIDGTGYYSGTYTIGGTLALNANTTNVAFKSDHTGSTGVYGAYDNTFFNTLGASSSGLWPKGIVDCRAERKPTTNTEYTFKQVSGAVGFTGTLMGWGQAQQGPTMLWKHDYCISNKVINSHLGTIRAFTYPVPSASPNEAQVIFTLHLTAAMEDATLPVAPTCAVADLSTITSLNTYASIGFGGIKHWGGGFGYNVSCAPMTTTVFSNDLTNYLNL